VSKLNILVRDAQPGQAQSAYPAYSILPSCPAIDSFKMNRDKRQANFSACELVNQTSKMIDRIKKNYVLQDQ